MSKTSFYIAGGRLRKAATRVVVRELTAMGTNLTAEPWHAGLLAVVSLRLGTEDESGAVRSLPFLPAIHEVYSRHADPRGML